MQILRSLLQTVFLMSLSVTAIAQGTAINTDGSPPDNSAILDVQSTTKGMLVPTMTSVQRENIASPAIGLLVFDNITRSFWYYTATGWMELTDNVRGLRDKDNDTKVQVEESPDEDIIRMDIGGVEAMVLDESSQGATRLDLGPDTSLIIGHDAGLVTAPGYNTIIGFQAGQSNSSGEGNVFLGYRAGQQNLDKSENVLIGFKAGSNNNAPSNTFVGYQAGKANTSGQSNTFMGAASGIQNTLGTRNTFLGDKAGYNNVLSTDNTLVGYHTGYYTTGNLNTFVGVGAGIANRTGQYNTVIGAYASGNPYPNRNLGNGNAILGYQAAYWADSIAENSILGYRAGYQMTNGHFNTFLGHEAGYWTQTGISNVAVGVDALHENRSGFHNVAVGDSTLYHNTATGNVAVGSKAGLKNTTGTSNTFIGVSAGKSNTLGAHNTMVGVGAGNFNKTGDYNVFMGAESASTNSDGNLNTFLGYATGFRNDSGSSNVFIGNRAAEFNIDGNTNIAIGVSALTRNSDGNLNIAIGDHALGDGQNETTSILNNIGIGQNAGRSIVGNENIIIGNQSGVGMGGTDNALLGNDINPSGSQNTYLGTATGAAFPFSPVKATAVGYGTHIHQDYSVILGDASNNQTKVGIGTTTPAAWLHIDGHAAEALRVSQNGTTALRVINNGNVVVDNQLLVNTTTGKPGYEMSVDGSIACEELLVQASEDWPDYVFASDYPLTTFDELRGYVKANNHLPGIPSASEVAETGVNVGDMQKSLLKKIEELTLYILALEDRIDQLENR